MDRREFLQVSVAAGGGLMLGLHGEAEAKTGATVEVGAWVLIAPDDTVTIRVARSEMGQGIMTALPMLVAEELGCDWTRVRSEYADPAEHLRRDRVYGSMSTGGSRSVRESHELLRKAGASAREMLLSAAAQRWKVPAGECSVARGVITHGPSRRRLRFGQVAEAAAKLPPPAQVTLKDPSQWTLLGQRKARLDTADKSRARTTYAIDVRLPGMLHASVAQCPSFGGRLRGWDESSVAGLPGVRGVVKVDDATVAVLADSTWRAMQAVKALKVDWDPGPDATRGSEQIMAFLKAGLDAPDAPVARQDGDADAALAAAGRRVEAEYYAPFLAHATMEPQNCTARVSGGRVEVWAPTQNGEAALAAAAEAAGVHPSQVLVHKMHLGGGFGRRGAFQDFVRQAVSIARQVDHPVKLTWSREEDIQHDFYRPVSLVRFTAALGDDGLPVALKARVAAHSILNFVRPAAVKDGLDRHSLGGIHDMPYAIPNLTVDFAMRNTFVPVGFWRAPSHCQNAFYLECFIDELAQAAGQDPYEYRRRLLSKAPKALAVLDAAARKAGWGGPLPAGVFRGIAMMESYGSHCAQVAEVSVGPDGQPRVHRVVCAIDPGYVVNPDTVEAQVESAIVYGLTAALWGEITVRDGRVEQSNFHDYPMLRMSQMPRVETVIVPSGGFWGGLGEPPLPPIAPAVANALFAATGKRVRSLPFARHDFRAA